MKSLALATLFAFALTPTYGFAQTSHNMSDEELINLALSAAPEAVAKDATVVAMDHDGRFCCKTRWRSCRRMILLL